jgi:hypothetical protein
MLRSGANICCVYFALAEFSPRTASTIIEQKYFALKVIDTLWERILEDLGREKQAKPCAHGVEHVEQLSH